MVVPAGAPDGRRVGGLPPGAVGIRQRPGPARPQKQRAVAPTASTISPPSSAIQSASAGRGPSRPLRRSFRGRALRHPIRAVHFRFAAPGCGLNSGTGAFRCSGACRLSGVHGAIDSSDPVHRFSTLLLSLWPGPTEALATGRSQSESKEHAGYGCKNFRYDYGRLIDWPLAGNKGRAQYFPPGYHFCRAAKPN